MRGEIRWCQGYSEPNAGSDLASLAMRAEIHDDHFLVNGQKIWTSYADESDWMFCLVRTDTAKKHTGISFILIDMTSPGVSTRPIKLISGKSPFCETFFENVQVPIGQLVGELNGGWTIAKYLLTHEREMIGAHRRALAAAAGGAFRRRAHRARRGRPPRRPGAARRDRALRSGRGGLPRLAQAGRASRPAAGEAHPAVSSGLKYYGAELNKRRWELMVAAGGADALEWEGARSQEGTAARTWLRTKGNSIEGGTSEVQLNVVAKRMLGLPG